MDCCLFMVIQISSWQNLGLYLIQALARRAFELFTVHLHLYHHVGSLALDVPIVAKADDTPNSFQTTFGQRPVAELGPALLESRGDERARVHCETEAVIWARLNELTNGLIDKLAPVQGVLIAGGAVVDALLEGRRRCSDVDIFLRCAPEEGLSKLRAVYDAVRQLALDAS